MTMSVIENRFATAAPRGGVQLTLIEGGPDAAELT
jgi:hypothetical protein